MIERTLSIIIAISSIVSTILVIEKKKMGWAIKIPSDLLWTATFLIYWVKTNDASQLFLLTANISYLLSHLYGFYKWSHSKKD